MPNRIIREGILTSEAVNSLSWEAEVFFRRLLSVVDDFGRFDARSSVLRSALYPLKLDSMREDSVQRCLKSCEAARLVVLYSIEGKEYLEVTNFRQQVRSKKSKYPAPDAHMRSTCLADAQHMHTKTESETKTNNTPSTPPSVHRGRSRRPSSGRGLCGACAFNPRPDTGLRHSLLGKPGCRQLDPQRHPRDQMAIRRHQLRHLLRRQSSGTAGNRQRPLQQP